MTKLDVNMISQVIEEVAEEHILPRFRNLKEADVAFKIGDDPVTIADKEAEKALSTRLLDLLPGSKVVGEEAFSSNQGILNQFFSESPVWIIDPIDGTRNFVRGSCKFGVIVALAEQNQTIAGWIYDPTSKEVVTTEKGSGTYFKGQKQHVLPKTTLSESHGFLGDRVIAAYEKSKLPNKIKPVFYEMSAGAHEYPRLVIKGPHFGQDEPQVHFRASLFHCTPWDDAAGVLMHQEAGGYSSFWNGKPYQPSVMNQGLALTPDKDSWLELKNWCLTFCDFPTG